jgi:hypothetical protein
MIADARLDRPFRTDFDVLSSWTETQLYPSPSIAKRLERLERDVE